MCGRALLTACNTTREFLWIFFWNNLICKDLFDGVAELMKEGPGELWQLYLQLIQVWPLGWFLKAAQSELILVILDMFIRVCSKGTTMREYNIVKMQNSRNIKPNWMKHLSMFLKLNTYISTLLNGEGITDVLKYFPESAAVRTCFRLMKLNVDDGWNSDLLSVNGNFAPDFDGASIYDIKPLSCKPLAYWIDSINYKIKVTLKVAYVNWHVIWQHHTF